MKTVKFLNKYRIPTNRLPGFDYGANGLYFVTICTKNRINYFGEIGMFEKTHNCASPTHELTHNCASPTEIPNNCASLQQWRPTTIGKIAFQYWQEIPKHYPFVETDEFIVMPNHIHGILLFNRPDKTDWTPNKFGVQSQNLGAVIRGFKSTTKRFANQSKIEFEWQPRYHDSIVRDERGLNAIRRYIKNNPKNWLIDTLNKTEL